MKRLISVILVISVLCLCSGCSLNFFSVESLMSPPAQSGKNGDVQAAFEKLSANKNIQLKTPVSGDYQTAFVLFDVNGDSVEEAFVFYSDSSVDASVRLAFLECINDTWVISMDIKGGGSSVYDISFRDMDNDGLHEIFVGWSLYNNPITKVVSIYELAQGENGVYTLNTLGNEYYNAKTFIDFNNDGNDDLVLVHLDDSREIQDSYFRCFSLSGSGALVKYGEVKLASVISSVSKIQTDTVTVNNEKTNRIFIDCLKSDSTMFTELVCWNTEKLKPFRAVKKPTDGTLRSSRVFCQDIDGDGILEIPVNSKMYGDESTLTIKLSGETFSFTMLKWMNSYGDKSEGNISTLFNPIDLYLYRITRVSEVTVRYDVYRKALCFCKWDEDDEVIKDELFSITFRSDKDNTVIIDEIDSELYRFDGGCFYYHITNYGKDFGITDESIISSFINIK